MNRLTLVGFSFIAVLLIVAIIGPAPAGAGQRRPERAHYNLNI